MKKLLLIVEAMGGGVRRHVIDLVQGLDPMRFDITLLYGDTRADDTFRAAMEALSCRATLIGSERLVRHISPRQDRAALREIRDVIARVQPDIVHCHSSKAGVLGRWAAKRAHVPQIYYTPHAYAFQAPEFSAAKRRLFISIERWFSRHATTLTFNVSQGERDCALAARLNGPGKFRVIYNGIPDCPLPDKAEARQRLGLPAEGFVAGVTARFNEQKDPFTFVKIAERILAESPQAHFVYIGDGPLYEAVSRYVQDKGLADRIRLPGYRTDAEELVTAFDVYLLTSQYEGLPYSPIEALRAGVPVVATRVVGNDEIVVPGINGALFAAGDAADGARVLEPFLQGSPCPAEQVRRSFQEKFALDEMLRQIEAVYGA